MPMQVYERDLIMKLLNKELMKQQDFQTQQMHHVASDIRENDFLGEIRQDYKKHYSFMLQQQREKEAQLRMLLDYLNKSAKQAKITQDLLLHTKGEKRRLLSEIDHVRGEIDRLIEENNKLIGT